MPDARSTDRHLARLSLLQHRIICGSDAAVGLAPPCGFVLSGESVAGAVPSPVVRVASPGPARAAAGRGTILHLGAVGYGLLRTIFTSNNVALRSITSTSQPSPWSKGYW